MPAIDDFATLSASPEGPVQHAIAVTPDDGADLPRLTRALYIGGAGNVQVQLKDGSTVLFSGMGAGWHPVRVARVMATNTTASDIVGCW